MDTAHAQCVHVARAATEVHAHALACASPANHEHTFT